MRKRERRNKIREHYELLDLLILRIGNRKPESWLLTQLERIVCRLKELGE